MSDVQAYPPSVDPGFPILPPTPRGWKRTTFSEVFDVVQRPVEMAPDQVYKLVTAKRNRGGIVLRSETAGRDILTKTQFEVRGGDFLISRRQIVHGACGVVPSSLDGAIVSNEYSVLRTRPTLLMEFLRHYCHTSYFQRTCFHASHGVAIEKMIFKLEEWLEREVDVPPLAEQRKIAAILSSVDETIEKTEAVIAQLDVVKKAMLEELLTRGIRSRKLEPIAEEWRLGRVLPGIAMKPEGWQLIRLTDVAKLESGHTPSRRHPEYWDGGVPWVSLHDTGALDGPEILETAQTVSDLGIANSSARLLPRGTVVFSRTATVGKATVLGREMSTSQDFANYVCGPRVHNRYLMHLLRFMQTEWARLMAGSTHQTIYMPVFRDLQVLLPEVREQERIAELADCVEARIQAERDSLVPMRAVKASLASELLSGATRVQTTGAT